jgi:hypothetical protein
VGQKEVQERYTEGDLSSILFSFDNPADAKKINFAAMIFGKELSKNESVTKNCEIKGRISVFLII